MSHDLDVATSHSGSPGKLPAGGGRRGRHMRWLAVVAIPVLLVVLVPAASKVAELHRLRSTALLPQTGQVALPPAAASPRQVVSAYVRAINAHDAEIARSLVKNGNRQEAASVTSWLEHATSMTQLRFRHIQRGPSQTEMLVSFDLHVNVDPPDMGLGRNGITYWFIILHHVASSGRWLITGEGSGP